MWGFNRRGQCGVEGGPCNTVQFPTPVVAVPPPTDVDLLGENRQLMGSMADTLCTKFSPSCNDSKAIEPDVYFAQLSLGRLHTAAISSDGHVYCWGASSGGRCGLGEHDRSARSAEACATTPQRLEGLKDKLVIQIACGDRHSLALCDDGQVYSWGMGSEGQLGHGHTMNLHTPRIIADLDFGTRQHLQRRGSDASSEKSTAMKINRVYASGCYSAALANTGDLFTWGYGDAGNLGHTPLPSHNAENMPKIEPGPMSKTGAGNRIRDSQSFDSRLNVLLPRRAAITRELGLRVVEAALGPGHMILLCEQYSWMRHGDSRERKPSEGSGEAPLTLFEIERGRRSKGLARLRQMGSARVLQGQDENKVASDGSSKVPAAASVAPSEHSNQIGTTLHREQNPKSVVAPSCAELDDSHIVSKDVCCEDFDTTVLTTETALSQPVSPDGKDGVERGALVKRNADGSATPSFVSKKSFHSLETIMQRQGKILKSFFRMGISLRVKNLSKEATSSTGRKKNRKFLRAKA